jgi:hypothetical protein
MQSFRELTGNRHRNQWWIWLSVGSGDHFDGDRTGSASLFPAAEEEIQKHADNRDKEDHENP